MSIPWTRPALVLDRGLYGGLKDPCVVGDGETWHLFATGCHEGYRYDLVHATAPHPAGPWTMLPPARLPRLDGSAVCAPGVVADGELLHLFLQQDYNIPGGSIRHLVSDDGGLSFASRGIALRSLADTTECGIYDAHPAEVRGRRYLVYSGFSVVGEPDLHLARSASASWDGPWDRLGVVLGHEHVPCHNQRGCPTYEWGLEGGQLTGLPDGRVLLNGVCFLPEGTAGDRQRVFFAVADRPEGPYHVLGPVIDPLTYADGGENGHGAVVVHDGRLYLYFQHRRGPGLPWLLYCAAAPADSVPDAGTGGVALRAGGVHSSGDAYEEAAG